MQVRQLDLRELEHPDGVQRGVQGEGLPQPEDARAPPHAGGEHLAGTCAPGRAPRILPLPWHEALPTAASPCDDRSCTTLKIMWTEQNTLESPEGILAPPRRRAAAPPRASGRPQLSQLAARLHPRRAARSILSDRSKTCWWSTAHRLPESQNGPPSVAAGRRCPINNLPRARARNRSRAPASRSAGRDR